jgi:hypothetical protein
MEPVPLRDAIRALRVEIVEAAEDASTQPVRFELGPIEMEFSVIAKREREVEGKIGFYIFVADTSVGGSGKATDELTQKVKLSLKPVRDYQNFRVWGRTMLLKEPSYAATQTAFDPG